MGKTLGMLSMLSQMLDLIMPLPWIWTKCYEIKITAYQGFLVAHSNKDLPAMQGNLGSVHWVIENSMDRSLSRLTDLHRVARAGHDSVAKHHQDLSLIRSPEAGQCVFVATGPQFNT